MIKRKAPAYAEIERDREVCCAAKHTFQMLLHSKGFSVIRGWIQVLLVADRHHTRKQRKKNLILLTDSKPCCTLLTEPHTSEFISPLRITKRSARNELVKKKKYENYDWSQQQDITHPKLVPDQNK